MDRRHCLASLAASFASTAWSASSGGGESPASSPDGGASAGHPSRAPASGASGPVSPGASAAASRGAPAVWPERAARAVETLREIERRTGGRLGVQVTDAAGGVLLSHRADERFPMCSTFKLLAAGAVLLRADRGQEQMSRRITYKKSDLIEYSPETQKHVAKGMTLAELCEAAVSLSDNTAANLILDSLGGPAGVTQAARGLGDTVTRLDRIEPALNDVEPGDERDTTSPAAMAADLRTLVIGRDTLSMSGRQKLQGWLRNCKTGDDSLRAGMPPASIVMNKTGTGPRGTRNDVGLVWIGGRGAPIAIAVYLTGATVGRPEQGAAIADVGRAVVGMLKA
jgi:beta-lactamase class A